MGDALACYSVAGKGTVTRGEYLGSASVPNSSTVTFRIHRNVLPDALREEVPHVLHRDDTQRFGGQHRFHGDPGASRGPVPGRQEKPA